MPCSLYPIQSFGTLEGIEPIGHRASYFPMLQCRDDVEHQWHNMDKWQHYLIPLKRHQNWIHLALQICNRKLPLQIHSSTLELMWLILRFYLPFNAYSPSWPISTFDTWDLLHYTRRKCVTSWVKCYYRWSTSTIRPLSSWIWSSCIMLKG